MPVEIPAGMVRRCDDCGMSTYPSVAGFDVHLPVRSIGFGRRRCPAFVPPQHPLHRRIWRAILCRIDRHAWEGPVSPDVYQCTDCGVKIGPS